MNKILLIKTGVLGVASVVVFGAVAAPFASFASEVSSETFTQLNEPRERQDVQNMMGPRGVVTRIDDRGHGTGSITMTLAVPERPEGAPELDASVRARIDAALETFFAAHPDAPRPGDDITITYDSRTKFMIGGEKASAADVTVGMSIIAMGTKPDSDEAAKMITDAIRPPMRHNGQSEDRGHRPHGMVGEVTSVDAEANTITVILPDDSKTAFTVGQRVHIGGPLRMRVGAGSTNE